MQEGTEDRMKHETNEERVVGPPGTGKTTFLATVLNYNAKQVGAENVIAISHTKAAAAEIAGRQLSIATANVGTLHSFAYQALDRPTIAEDAAHLKDFGKYNFSCCNDTEELEFTNVGDGEGDRLLAEYGRLRNLTTPRSIWPTEVLAFAKDWEDYKRETYTVDFSDLIELATHETKSPLQQPLVICVDEAQDTSRLQWELIHHWAKSCDKLITCGDADQTIYAWAGADATYFVENTPTRQRILEQSYRVPIAAHKFAQSWIRQITNRVDVVYKPRDYPGILRRHHATHKTPEELIPLVNQTLAMPDKTIMLQAGCEYMLRPLVALLRKEGIPFSNPWRKKQGAWNPLQRRGDNSTVVQLLEFLKPQGTGRLWDKAGYERWTKLVKGFFKRGGRSVFFENALKVHTPDELFEQLASQVADENDLSSILTAPPECLDWLEAHLTAAKKGPAEYPLRVLRRYGSRILDETPRVFVGTIHSFKGSEADNVVVFPDLSFQGYQQWVGEGFADVVRLYYVAVTRARENLYLCSPASSLAVWS